jgi:DNA helicase-2/ATP-dependent DNA helicase PcrA
MERSRPPAAPAPADGIGDTRFEDALARLTAPQREAVENRALPLCIVAGAGSGKTRVLTLRAASRIRDGSALADHTVVCTFTRKAAAELRQRLVAYGIPVSTVGRGRIPSPGVRAGTVHQLALTLIRRHCLDTERPVPLVLEQRAGLLRPLAEDPGQVAVLTGEIAWAKARGLSPDEYGSAATDRHPALDVRAVVEGFRAYEASLARRHALDLDDLLVRAADLLESDPGFAERMRWRYRHVAVDEFQDVNPAQFRLLRALLGDSRDLCVVGDPHQAVYGWNGADPTLLDRLPELLGPTTVLELADNHRSTAPIVELADAVLGDERRYRARSVAGAGPAPSVTAYADDRAEADGVAAVLTDWRAAGIPWAEQAVLARTHDQLAVLARGLARAGVPHRMASAESALERGPRDGRVTGGDGPDGGPAAGQGADAAAVRVEAVELSTFHRAKGAEWTAVCVTGLEDGLVPIVYAADRAARSEERRLLHVAVTRAGRELACSWARRRTTAMGRVSERQPSPWLPATRPMASGPTSGRVGEGPRGVADRMAGLRAALYGRS